MIPTHSLRKSMYIPSSKKELVVLKNECFVSQPLVNPQSRNVNHGHRATLSSIILSKQLLSTQQVSNNLTQISEDTMSNSNESRSKRTVDSSITGRKNPFVANNEYNDNYIGKSRTNHNRRLSCDYNRGVVEFYKSPMKSHKRSYSIESREKKYDNDQCIKQIIKLQSIVRKYLLRKKLFNMIMSYYKSQTFVQHLIRILTEKESNDKYYCFQMIKMSKKRKYYLTRKQINLLEELRKRKITNTKELNAYFDWLEKTKI